MVGVPPHERDGLPPDVIPEYDRKEPEPRASANVNTLHYNGSVVCHPDTTGSYEKKVQGYTRAGLCHRGCQKTTCPALLQYWRDQSDAAGKPRYIDLSKACHLDKSPEYKKLCPAHLKTVADGCKEKTFVIDNRVYNELADRAAWLYNASKNKLLFITLTFPKFKRKVNENELNEAFSRFIENCRATYDADGYIGVREGDGVTKRYHYHIILSIPFVDFRTLNSAWLHAIQDFCHYSPNALTTDRKARFIKSVNSAVRYVCKYMSKSRNAVSKTRIYFVDRRTAQAIVKTPFDYSMDTVKTAFPSLRSYQYNDYVCRYTIADRREADEFFKAAVLILFSHSEGDAELYFYPPE